MVYVGRRERVVAGSPGSRPLLPPSVAFLTIVTWGWSNDHNPPSEVKDLGLVSIRLILGRDTEVYPAGAGKAP